MGMSRELKSAVVSEEKERHVVIIEYIIMST